MSDKPKKTDEPKIDEVTSVHNWLEKEGYPVEMKAARAMQDHGFRVTQGEYVLSQDRETLRETDAIGTLTHVKEDYGPQGPTFGCHWECVVAAECKAPKNPWVAFTRKPQVLQGFMAEFHRFASPVGQTLLRAAMGSGELRKLAVFTAPERLAYSIRQSQVEQSAPFAPTLQVIDQTLHYVDRGLDYNPDCEICRIVFPVLVVDHRLYECWLDDDGKIQLERRDEMRLYWQRPSGGKVFQIVDVVTLAGFPAYLAKVRELFEMVRDKHEGSLIEFCRKVHRDDDPSD